MYIDRHVSQILVLLDYFDFYKNAKSKIGAKTKNGKTPSVIAREHHKLATALFIEQFYTPTKSANFIA
jgi:hypothetical protein